MGRGPFGAQPIDPASKNEDAFLTRNSRRRSEYGEMRGTKWNDDEGFRVPSTDSRVFLVIQRQTVQYRFPLFFSFTINNSPNNSFTRVVFLQRLQENDQSIPTNKSVVLLSRRCCATFRLTLSFGC